MRPPIIVTKAKSVPGGKITLEEVAVAGLSVVADIDVWLLAATVKVAGSVVFDMHPIFNSTAKMRARGDIRCKSFIRFFIFLPPAHGYYLD